MPDGWALGGTAGVNVAGTLNPMRRPCREDFSPSWQGFLICYYGRNEVRLRVPQP